MVKNRSPPNSFQFWKENRFEDTTNWYRSLFQTVDLFFLSLSRLKKAFFVDFQVKGKLFLLHKRRNNKCILWLRKEKVFRRKRKRRKLTTIIRISWMEDSVPSRTRWFWFQQKSQFSPQRIANWGEILSKWTFWRLYKWIYMGRCTEWS